MPKASKKASVRMDANSEQKTFLKNLFQNGKVTSSTKPKDLKDQHEIFADVSSAVFGAHFNSLKRLHGIDRK